MIETHLPALQVVLPLLAAPLCVVANRARFAWALATLVSWTALVIAVRLLDRVLSSGVIVYAMGGWAAPWGIEYRIDAVNALVLLIVAGISAVVLPFARLSVEREIEPERITLFYTGWLLCLSGLLGIVITGDAFNVFVFLEISSLSSYLLISLGKDRRALLAAFQYLVMGTVGATFILIGIGLLYVMTGTLNMLDLANRIPEVIHTRTIKAAFAFLVVGIGIKAAIFPLHAWLPNAYAYAPSPVTAFLAGTATKVAIYVWLRFFFTIFGGDFSWDVMRLDRILLPLALLGIFAGSLAAIFQRDIKRMLAYSSIAQIGYIILGISLASVAGLTAAIVHLFNHALIKTALFMVLGCIVYRRGTATLNTIAGLGRDMPLTMAAFVLGGLSLIGVPLTVGFISKWYLILAALEYHSWVLAALILISSLLAVIYVWRVVEAAYFLPPREDQPAISETPAGLLIPSWLLIAANVYFGIDASFTTTIAERASLLLSAGTP